MTFLPSPAFSTPTINSCHAFTMACNTMKLRTVCAAANKHYDLNGGQHLHVQVYLYSEYQFCCGKKISWISNNSACIRTKTNV